MKAKKVDPCLCFDASTYFDPTVSQKFWDAGYRVKIRYVNRERYVRDTPDTKWPVSLAKQELNETINKDSKWGLSIVQFAPFGVTPNAMTGKAAGDAAGWNCRELGIPEGTTVWCDLEWNTVQRAEDVLEYANAWSKALDTYVLRVGGYIGPNLGCTGEQLYRDIPLMRHYWKSAAIVPWVEKRGFQLAQSLEIKVFGQTIDQNIAMFDNKGDRFYVVKY